jgi:hypothetical protein
MTNRSRRFMAEIGRRGGIRSRRALSAEQARDMVVARESRRAVSRFAASPFARATPLLPGLEIIESGLAALAAGRVTDEALLVSIAAPRLRLLGIRVPRVIAAPEETLYARLDARLGDGAHSAYNALIRRIVSFARAAAQCAR